MVLIHPRFCIFACFGHCPNSACKFGMRGVMNCLRVFLCSLNVQETSLKISAFHTFLQKIAKFGTLSALLIMLQYKQSKSLQLHTITIRSSVKLYNYVIPHARVYYEAYYPVWDVDSHQ